MIKKKILIATGGTGGHVFPAYSLANFLQNNNYNVEVTTDLRGFRYLKDHKKIKIIKMPASPLITNNVMKFLISLLTIFFSISTSLFYLVFNRPSIIFGMGGYSSFPICIAASILRIKFVIYENNLIIGKANKYLLPFAKKIFVTFKEIEGINKNYNSKVLELGNIIREEIINSKISNFEINTFENPKILVLGGSQAARVFAEELPEIFKKLKDDMPQIKIYQQCQEEQKNHLSNFYQENNIDHEVFNFSDKIINYYSKANLVITRSGASVLGELINIKVPFILIPFPFSADNHQYKNAKFYEQRGYGYLLDQKNIKDKLFDLIKRIFNDKSLIKNILSKQGQYSDKDIFRNLNIQLEKILNEKN